MSARKRYSSVMCAIMTPYCSAGMGRARPTRSHPAAPVGEDVGEALPKGDPGPPAGQGGEAATVPAEDGHVHGTDASWGRPDLDRAAGHGQEAVQDLLD